MISLASTEPAFNSVTRSGAAGSYSYTAAQGSATDGVVAGDQSVMYKTLNTADWVFNNGYWYFKHRLTSGSSTGNLLDSLVLANNADTGAYITKEYYSTTDVFFMNLLLEVGVAEDIEAGYAWTEVPAGGFPDTFDQRSITYKKSESKLDPSKSGYANADYTLTIVTELCQATAAAVTAEWGIAAPSGTSWGLT